MVQLTYFSELSWLSVLLIVGILLYIISYKTKISNIFLLLLAGIVAGRFVDFSPSFMAGFATFALIMIIFDSTSKFKLKEIETYYGPSIKLTLTFLFFTVIALTVFIFFLFNFSFTLESLLLALIFSSLMVGTSPDVILSSLKETKTRVIEVLKFESILNTPLSVLAPLIFLQIYQGGFDPSSTTISFIQNVATGIGLGLVLGFIIFRVMRRSYLEEISPLVVVATALLSYTLAEAIGGNGVLAVTTLGVVYGAMVIKQKENISKFVDIFTTFLKIVTFILIGLVIALPTSLTFFIKSLILFALYLLIRFAAIEIAFLKTDLTRKEKVFMSLQVSKGVAVAVVTLILTSFAIEGMSLIINLSLLFILYSIVLTSLMSLVSGYFVKNTERKIESIKKPKNNSKSKK
ncbi:cation:proton antiporter [Candidatus Woesearchaeota archaeon]|nr:cation:proton antiporter [Candidatus Woesearchaeota archaeon]